MPDTNIDSSNRYSLARIADVNERRYGRFVQVQSANAAQRMELHHQLDNFQYILDRLQRSLRALNSGARGGKTELAPKSKARLKRLEGRLHTDAEELSGHIQSTVLLMSLLREGDRHAEEVGNALHNSLQALSNALRRNESDQDDNDPMYTSASLVPAPSSRSEVSNSTRPPMADELAKFCDAVGDFKIMRERIDELHLEKQEQEERKEFLGDQELKLEKRNENFLLNWHQSLAEAKNDLQEAEVIVSRARQVCEDAGISIPLWAETNPAFSDVYQEYNTPAQLATINPPMFVVLPRSSGHGVGSSINSSEPAPVDASSLMFNPLNEQPSSDEKIANWIQSVQPDVPDVSDPSSELVLASARKDIASTIEYRFAQLRAPQP
jgi:hypothetical protein